MMKLMNDILDAISFSVKAHHPQTRQSGKTTVPHSLHAIKTAKILIMNNVVNPDIIKAGILHDVMSVTSVTREGLEERFGAAVASYVKEVTPPVRGDKAEQKQNELKRFPTLDYGAKCIKLAEETANVLDLAEFTPNWSLKAMRGYINYARELAITAGEDTKDAILVSLINSLWRATSVAADKVDELENIKINTN